MNVKRLRHPLSVIVIACLTDPVAAEPVAVCADTRFEVTCTDAAHAGPITGRLILILVKDDSPEPRLAVHPLGPVIAGIDIEQVRPGDPIVIDDTNAITSPINSLAELPPGDYFAQAVIHIYTHVQRADGRELWVPLNDGTISTFNIAPGNLYSDVTAIRIDPEDGEPDIFSIEIDNIIPQASAPRDTEWVRHLPIQSERLTEFWGHPVYINATVLLPRGYHEEANANVRYPTIYTFGHRTPFNFDANSRPSQRDDGIHPVTGLESSRTFYESWTSDDFPRVIAVSFQQQTPFFPDSYSVNSANNGPYGDAIIEEVIPRLEAEFRMIGEPYARILEGASTGGWQTLALQLKHPDVFGGAWVLQPDPISFDRYGLVNIYEDDNAFEVRTGPFTTTERPMRRTVDGQVLWTMRDLSRFEAALGSRGRSGFQLDAWHAVYGPLGDDGYPKPLWDPHTGEIDHEVATYMRNHGYDLLEYARRNWAELQPKLRGKLHFFCGDMDDFYLNLAVYRFEEFIREADEAAGVAEPTATFTWGRPRKGHSWHATTWAEMVIEMAEHVQRRGPRGAPLEWWRR